MISPIPEAFVKMMNGAETMDELARVGRLIAEQVKRGYDYTKDEETMTMLRSNYGINLKRIEIE